MPARADKNAPARNILAGDRLAAPSCAVAPGAQIRQASSIQNISYVSLLPSMALLTRA